MLRPGEILDMSPRVHSHLWIKPSFLSIGPQITHYYVLMHGTLFHGSPNTLSSMPPACALVVWMERQTDTWGVAGCASRLESRRGTARGELDRCRKGLESTLISGGEVHSKRGPQDINPHGRWPVEPHSPLGPRAEPSPSHTAAPEQALSDGDRNCVHLLAFPDTQ